MSIDGILDQNDVVISSRIRLARNIADFPFVSICSDDQRARIESTVRDGLLDDQLLSQLAFVDSLELEALERQFLLDLEIVNCSDVDSDSSTAVESLMAVAGETATKINQAETGPLDDLCLTINEKIICD